MRFKEILKRVIITVLPCLVLYGCAFSTRATDIIPKNDITLFVYSNSPTFVIEGANIFAEKINTLSRSRVSAKVLLSDTPVDDLTDNGTGLALLPVSGMSSYGNDFDMLCSPFFFDSDTHSSMTMNSLDFHDLFDNYIAKNTGAKLLESIYTDSQYLISDTVYPADVTELAETTIYIPTPCEMLSDVLSFYNALPVYSLSQLEGAKRRMALYSPNSPGEELPFSSSESVYILQAPIMVENYWVLANDTAWQGYDDGMKNLIKKSISYLTAHCEEERITKNKDLIMRYANREISVQMSNSTEFPRSFQNYFKTQEKYKSHWNTEIYSSVQVIIR